MLASAGTASETEVVKALCPPFSLDGTDSTVSGGPTRALEVVSDEPAQVECVECIGPRGGTADASVLGADHATIRIARTEATASDSPSYLPIVASVSTDSRRTEVTAAERGMLPGMLPGDSAKAAIDAAWDGLREDVKANILAIVHERHEAGGR